MAKRKKEFRIFRVEARVPKMERFVKDFKNGKVSFCKDKKSAKKFEGEAELFDVLGKVRRQGIDLSFEIVE